MKPSLMLCLATNAFWNFVCSVIICDMFILLNVVRMVVVCCVLVNRFVICFWSGDVGTIFIVFFALLLGACFFIGGTGSLIDGGIMFIDGTSAVPPSRNAFRIV